MGKISKLEMEEAKKEMEMFALETFENFCNACDNFETDNCPFRGSVGLETEWENIGCKNFYD